LLTGAAVADILLTHSNHIFSDRKQVRKMQPYPPLQTLIAAALLRREGLDVALWDSTFESPEAGFRAALDRHRPRLVAVCEDNFNFLTKMCLTENRRLAHALGRAARDAGIPALCNGSDSTDRAEEYLVVGFDAVILGELEATLSETAAALLSGRPLDAVAGIAYRERDGVRNTPSRERLTDLDALPPPAWDLAPIERYRDAWKSAHGYFSLNLVSSRGCPYHCNWCAKPIYGQSYHCVSPRRAAEEMARVKNDLGAEHVWFADDIFALSGSWTSEFAREVAAADAELPFKMQSRCDLMTRDTVAALRSAGCAEVWMGAESGSQAILDAMDKGTRIEQIYEARGNLRRHGIRACFFLQFGYPGETWDEIRDTIRLVRETEPDDIGVSVAYPLPGTKFHERVARDLVAQTNWSDSDDLAMMFRGSYGADFYRALRDALHLEQDLRLGAESAGGHEALQSLWSRVEQLERTTRRDVCGVQTVATTQTRNSGTDALFP
jgi:anaerobic magnesium-protoporphyrin IX monomethyl ester cyclase